MKTRLIYLFSITATLFLASCSNDDDNVDTEAPVITIAEPHDEEGISPGGDINFNAVFTDNVELASYKIEVHNSFDDHSHTDRMDTHQDNPWSYNEIFTIPEGHTSFSTHFDIPVPAMINGEPISEGHYHFGVYVTDTSGNESQAFLELHIEEGAGDDHDH